MNNKEFQTNRHQYMVTAGLLFCALALLSTSLKSMENSSQANANAIAAQENRKPLKKLLQNEARKLGLTLDPTTMVVHSTEGSYWVEAMVQDSTGLEFGIGFYDLKGIKKGIYTIEWDPVAGEIVMRPTDGSEVVRLVHFPEAPGNDSPVSGITNDTTAGGRMHCWSNSAGFVGGCFNTADPDSPLPP